MSASMAPKVTGTLHRAPYAAISPDRPELSQKGRTVLVTGSSAGIGLAIARNFARAGATTIILTGRRESVLNSVAQDLEAQFPNTVFVKKQIDAANSAGVKILWDELDAQGIVVDVLVLNVARVQPHPGAVIELEPQEVMADFVTNVGALHEFAYYFYHQPKRTKGNKLSLVNVSTSAIHDFDVVANVPNYSASKNAGALLVQQIAKGISANDMQVLSYHPGAIYTPGNQAAGFKVEDFDWDDEELPGQYAVWAASDEAKSLHGRFTWAAWDVKDLCTGPASKLIEKHAGYLKIGVSGI